MTDHIVGRETDPRHVRRRQCHSDPERLKTLCCISEHRTEHGDDIRAKNTTRYPNWNSPSMEGTARSRSPRIRRSNHRIVEFPLL